MKSDAEKSLKEIVYQRLLDKIIFGKLVPGDIITEEELCREFYVSRTPVRESMLDLEREGYISIEPRKFTRVAATTQKTVADILELRLLLEIYAVRSRDGPLSDADAERFRQFGGRFRAIGDSPDNLTELLRADFEFHSALVALSGNGVIEKTARGLLMKSAQLWRLMLTENSHNGMAVSAQEHQTIIAALLAGKYEDACVHLEHHINKAYRITKPRKPVKRRRTRRKAQPGKDKALDKTIEQGDEP